MYLFIWNSFDFVFLVEKIVVVVVDLFSIKVLFHQWCLHTNIYCFTPSFKIWRWWPRGNLPDQQRGAGQQAGNPSQYRPRHRNTVFTAISASFDYKKTLEKKASGLIVEVMQWLFVLLENIFPQCPKLLNEIRLTVNSG